MPSISPSETARLLLDACRNGLAPDPELAKALAGDALASDDYLAAYASRALFSELVEPLADAFEPAYCDCYAAFFAHVIERAYSKLEAAQLTERYFQVRRVRQIQQEPRRVVIPSRVTLGADVAITSLFLDAAKQRFPDAEIVFAGSKKAWELFEKDSRLSFALLHYGRAGLLRDRLAVWEELRDLTLAQPDTILLDPDSRVTQLGLMPVCSADGHYLFESRSFGGDGLEPLPVLARRWLYQTLGVTSVEPYIAPKFRFDFGDRRVATASLGVGENPSKKLSPAFEAGLIRTLFDASDSVMVDRGAGGEEGTRVERAIAALGESAGHIGVHEGPFASFAAMIAASSFYAGYDSAGQHVAAALGIPLFTAFAGFPCERMLARWTPHGEGPRTVVPCRGQAEVAAIAELERALSDAYGAR